MCSLLEKDFDALKWSNCNRCCKDWESGRHGLIDRASDIGCLTSHKLEMQKIMQLQRTFFFFEVERTFLVEAIVSTLALLIFTWKPANLVFEVEDVQLWAGGCMKRDRVHPVTSGLEKSNMIMGLHLYCYCYSVLERWLLEFGLN